MFTDYSQRIKTMTIEEIELFLRNEVISNISPIYQNLLIAGRINGNGLEMIKRLEDEAIHILHEHWVK